MLSTYTYPRYAYQRPPELDAPGTVPRHPVVVVGAGPVGLAAAIDLAQMGQPVVLLDDDDTVSVGSRGLCYAKRALEVLDRLGVGDAVVAKGVTWNVGRTFHGDAEVFRFNLLPEADHERPGMVNLQQYYLEQYLVERAQQLPNLTLRWKHKVTAVQPNAQGARLSVETADGSFELDADWLVVADGARSPIRRMLGLDIEGKVFQDRFLIADVVMRADFPAERWFWFDPPFHRNQSVLLHREADNVWRIDFQLGWDADPEAEKQPERVIPRIQAMLGPDHAFDLEWVSVYTFQCRRMTSFRHGRVLFAGDAAHQVSPFGARGANSGLQDTDNLVWKLDLVMRGLAPEALLDSYSAERVAAADENLMNSTRSTDFITPKSQVSRDFRNAVLTLAGEHAFARALVNSGRLSVPAHLLDSALNTPDAAPFEGLMRPGAPMADAPVQRQGRPGWLLREAGNRFQLMLFVPTAESLSAAQREAIARLADAPIPVHTLLVAERDGVAPAGATLVVDATGTARHRYDARPGTAYLLRPDQHVAARWRQLDAAAVRAAVARATCQD
ncbi:FAD-dependent oxidoreductase [Ideonella sp. DXS22W]|uniref:FAD-dependent oxidoreductase n=1 Tax=Pseudaquabacterium inlustre TaxID=2984192 RepID=A0ABU9CLG2_9BURK